MSQYLLQASSTPSDIFLKETPGDKLSSDGQGKPIWTFRKPDSKGKRMRVLGP